MSKFFINHPIPALVFSIILTIVGILTATRLPVAEYPDIAPPTVFVSTTYIGADASVIDKTVAQIIEEAVNSAGNIDYMSSTIDTSGSYNLKIVFQQGLDIDTAAVRVQNKISTVMSDLPNEVQSRGVTVSKNTPGEVLIVNLISPNGTYDGAFLRNYATVYFIDKIKRVNGVGNVDYYGGEYSMRIWLDPDKLSELGLAVSDVVTAIQEQNIQAAVGSIGKMPADILQEHEFVLRSTNRKETPADFENIIVKSVDGTLIYLKDIARVEVGMRSVDTIALQDGRESSAFSLKLTNDANTLETISEVKKILADAEKNLPPDMKLITVLDTTRFINASLTEVAETFVEALILVVVIVWIFLQDFRSMIIALLAIPVSIVATFIVFPAVGFTINTLTLFALILAIGLVVDDAIVVIEIVEKKLESGMEIKEATLSAMQEIQAPIVAIACVLAAVFVPAAFLEGITGELYRQFALTIVVSMIFSTIIALTLTPALCVLILKPHEKKSSSSFFDRIKSKFEFLLEKVIRQKIVAIIILIALAGGTFFMSEILPNTYLPLEDEGDFVVAVTLPEGTSMNVTIDTLNKFSAALKNIDGVTNVAVIAGMDIINGVTNSNAGEIFGTLADWEERDTHIFDILDSIDEMAPEVIPEAEIFSISVSSMPGLDTLGEVSVRLLDVNNHSDEELAKIAEEILDAANNRPELDEVIGGFSISKPYIDVHVDENKAKLLGVNLDDVYSALRVNFGGDEVNDFTDFGHVYKVVLQADSHYRKSIDAAKFIFVRNSNDELVPLDTLVTFTETTGISQIARYNGVRCIIFEGNAGEGFSSGQALDAMEEVIEEVAPNTFQIEWAEKSRQEKLAQSSVVEIFALALLFVFLCLVSLYESWKIPFAVMLSVPTGIFGAFVAEIVTGNLASVYMHIGILVIIGLAVKNAILVVEFAQKKVESGQTPLLAAKEAAVERLRPILMTSLAFVVACIPLALATGAGAAARNCMGAAVVGGMFFATLIGVFVVPILFVMICGVDDSK